ncbi:hypothetical protein IWX62_002974 [Arthrobacter sp. CAN_A1]
MSWSTREVADLAGTTVKAIVLWTGLVAAAALGFLTLLGW